MACYAVTGGAGFIGSHIVSRLLADGHAVRAVDNFSTCPRGNLDGAGGDVTLLEGDICDSELLRRAFDGADCVFHQAALASVQRSIEDPLATNRVNVEGTLQVLQTARECGVRRVVYASSSSVYGDAPTLPKHEGMPPAPKSPYAVSKLAGEQYCRVYSDVLGLETVALRYFNVFGPRQDPAGQYAAVIPLFIRAMLEGTALKVFGDGEQSRDFTYVDNVVEANLLAAQADGASGLAINVGYGIRCTLNALLAMLAEIIGCPVEPTYAPERAGDVRHSRADIALAHQALNYEPSVDLQEGIRRTVEWHRAQPTK